MARYKEVHNLRTNATVAKRMGISDTALSNQLGRRSLNLELIVESADPDVNLHWLIKGNGPMRININEDQDQKSETFLQFEKSADNPSNDHLDRDELLDFLLEQQKTILDFLRKLKMESSRYSDDS